MKKSLVLILLAGLTLATPGCVSKRKAEARAREAFIAGQQQSMLRQTAVTTPTVFVTGQVRFPTIPWTPDLTLAQAIVNAGYMGEDPKLIIIHRGGQPISVEPQRLLNGEDFPLVASDSIEIR